MVRRTLIIIGILWAIAILAVLYMYFGKKFTLYSDTVKASPSAPLHESALVLTSSAFQNNGGIPSTYTCDVPAQAGEKQISPPLTIAGAPAGTQTFVLITEDRDVPKSLVPSGIFLHWVLFNIPAETTDIGVGEVAGIEGASGNGVAGYVGPCPPPQYEPSEHRYYFDLYALDSALNVQEGSSVDEIRTAMEGHILAQATLVGRYAREEK